MVPIIVNINHYISICLLSQAGFFLSGHHYKLLMFYQLGAKLITVAQKKNQTTITEIHGLQPKNEDILVSRVSEV